MSIPLGKPVRYARAPSLSPRLHAQPQRMPTATIPTERIMGRTLQGIRRRHLQQQPLCVTCKKHGRTTAATQIDHVRPLWDGGQDDEGNRQGLCDECHRKKTAAEAATRLTPR